MNWKEEFDLRFKNWREDPEFWRSDMKDFISTLIEKIIEDIFAYMPTTGESGETIYLDVKEVGEFKQQLKDKWLIKP